MAPTYLSDLHALLAQPDPVDLPKRGCRVTCAGDPLRFTSVYLPLVKRWAITHQAGKDKAPFIGKARKGYRLIVADRRWRRLA